MRRAAPLLVAAALCAGPRPAAAVYQCGDQRDDCQCAMSDPYPCCDNGGNCTWWAWEAACCNWAVGLPGWGNANQWAGNARANAGYDVLAAPVVGSVACRVSGTYGHVAWVTAVNGGGITVTEENCCTGCNYGMRSQPYSDWHYFDGGFIIRTSQCECSPGDTQTQGCGQCGTQSRGCGADCTWGSWGGCGGEGPCAPGAVDTQACGDCGQQSRTCSGSCQWGDLGACAGPDPNGGTDPCSTGQPGICAAGVRRCVDGNLQCVQTAQPAAETCDGLDNDCNGETDENGVCPDAGPPPDLDAAAADAPAGPAPDGPVRDGAPAPAEGAGRALAGGCGCQAPPGSPAALGLGALALLLARRGVRKTSQR